MGSHAPTSFLRAPRASLIPSRGVRAGVVAGLLLAGTVVGAGTALASNTPQDFARLRQCESGGNYSINTGNGYYGAYQFDTGTWHSLGYGGLPSQASPAVQDDAARRLQAARGWSPWPSCSRQLGLNNSPNPVSAPPPAAKPAPKPAPPAPAPVAAPPPPVMVVMPPAPPFSGSVTARARRLMERLKGGTSSARSPRTLLLSGNADAALPRVRQQLP